MKKIYRFFTLLLAVLLCASSLAVYALSDTESIEKTHRKGSIATAEEIAYFNTFADTLFGDPAALPFSFTMNEKHYRGFDSDFTVTRLPGKIIGNYQDSLEITLHYSLNPEYLQMEWYVTLTNRGDAPSPVIRDLLSADLSLKARFPSLTYSIGDVVNDAYSHASFTEALCPGMRFAFNPEGGKSTGHQRPYYRLDTGYHGYTLAIGWQGRWKASFEAQSDSVTVQAGQYAFSSYLEAGETVQTPSTVLLCYESGNTDRAINHWRRWFYDCAYVRDTQGNITAPRAVIGCSMSVTPDLTAEKMLNDLATTYQDTNYNLYWIDAGWYFLNGTLSLPVTTQSFKYTGTWRIDTTRFPSRFSKVREAIGEDRVMVLWFEPERARAGTELYSQTDYMLSLSSNTKDRLANMGNPAYVHYIASVVNTIMEQSGADIYRQDFNFDPYPYWEEHDAAQDGERQGITENLYIQGLMQYYDLIMEAHPDFPIDMCASGGMRNDISVSRFSTTLTLTDTTNTNLILHQNIRLCLNEWFSTFCGSGAPGNNYAILSNLSYFTAPSNVPIWEQINHLFLCDYYPLTEYSQEDDAWVGWEFYDTEYREGFFVAFRRENNPDLINTFFLKGLDPEKDYQIRDLLTGKKTNATGRELMEDGFRFFADPGAAKIFKITEQ